MFVIQRFKGDVAQFSRSDDAQLFGGSSFNLVFHGTNQDFVEFAACYGEVCFANILHFFAVLSEDIVEFFGVDRNFSNT